MSQAVATPPKVQPAPKKPAAYEMPLPEVGTIVHWFAGGDLFTEPQAAIVSKVSPWSVCVNLITPTSYNMMIRDGVRHASDPHVEKRGPDVTENGAWDYTPLAKKLLALVS